MQGFPRRVLSVPCKYHSFEATSDKRISPRLSFCVERNIMHPSLLGTDINAWDFNMKILTSRLKGRGSRTTVPKASKSPPRPLLSLTFTPTSNQTAPWPPARLHTFPLKSSSRYFATLTAYVKTKKDVSSQLSAFTLWYMPVYVVYSASPIQFFQSSLRRPLLSAPITFGFSIGMSCLGATRWTSVSLPGLVLTSSISHARSHFHWYVTIR